MSSIYYKGGYRIIYTAPGVISLIATRNTVINHYNMHTTSDSTVVPTIKIGTFQMYTCSDMRAACTTHA